MELKITELNETRDDLAVKFKELGFHKGAEIGTDRGLYAEILCKSNPGVKLFCIDPWKIYPDNTDYPHQRTLDINYQLTQKRLKPFNVEIIKRSSMGVINEFEDNSLDFVYIDANHNFKYVLEDINKWSKKVRTGGIVSGHDYIWRPHGHRRYDVKEALEIHSQIYNIDELFLLTKRGGSTWYYVKP
jgi:Methyltransferase domain